MKRNKTRAQSLIFVAILLFSALSSYGFAEAEIYEAESEAQVEFTPGQGPTFPVDPDDPKTPGNGLGATGALAIVSVSAFDFGVIPISNITEQFAVTTSQPNIQIVDLRGTESGWRVSARVTRFESGEESTLPGAAIHIINGRPNSVSASVAPTPVADTILTTDGAPHEVMFADEGAGTGQWVMRWYPSGAGAYVKLEIPAGSATLGSHAATITWTLEDVV